MELFVPLVVAAMIDVGIAGGDVAYILRMTGILILLAAVGLALSMTAQFFAAKAAVGFVKRVRHVLFAHLQKLSFGQLDTLGTSSLITRMTSDMNQLQSGVNLTLRLLLRSPFVVVGAMVMAFTVDTRAALVFAVEIPLLAVVIFGLMLASIPLYRKVQNRLDEVLGLTRENLTGVRVLRAFCKEEEQKEAFTQRNQKLTQMQKFVGRISALLNPVTYIIVNGAIIVLIWIGALRVENGLLTQGSVVALYNYMAQILIELVKFATFVITITRAVACGNRVQAILEVRPEYDGENDELAEGQMDDYPSREPRIEFRQVCLRYPGAGDEALSEIDFSVMPGETVGIIGGTGSGKTSLVNLIPRFYDVSSGEVRMDGVDVQSWNRRRLRERIGVVPQKAVLFSGTIRDNLLWGKADATDEEIFAALNAAQALEIIEKKELGLDSPVEQGGRNFSGGQRQRLTIARALLKKPEILILDDSASALDQATDAALRRAIGELEPKPTLFLVSQRSASVVHADRILVLEDGRLVGNGRHEELLLSCPVYQEIYQSQQ